MPMGGGFIFEYGIQVPCDLFNSLRKARIIASATTEEQVDISKGRGIMNLRPFYKDSGSSTIFFLFAYSSLFFHESELLSIYLFIYISIYIYIVWAKQYHPHVLRGVVTSLYGGHLCVLVTQYRYLFTHMLMYPWLREKMIAGQSSFNWCCMRAKYLSCKGKDPDHTHFACS